MAKTATFLDSNAGAPLHPRARESVIEALSVFAIANPSSIHAHGRKSKRLLAEAREKIAHSLGPSTDPEQLIFTSSGTEANQLAIRSALEPRLLRGEKPHWITTPVEHDSTLQMAEWLKARGGSVSFLPVNAEGEPEAAALAALIRPETALVSVVWVNNETGVVADAGAIARVCNERRIPLHLDAAQAWGKLPLDIATLGASFVALSAHKIGALAGTGILWVGRGVRAEALIRGKQEKGRRAGTENLVGIVAAGAAAAELSPAAWAEKLEPLRDRLQDAICHRIPGTTVNGGGARKRAANTLNLSFDGIEGEGLVMALDLAGYSVSSGSACASGVLEPSHVLLAMGRTPAQATAALRISLPGDVSWEVLEGFVGALEAIVSRLRGASGLRTGLVESKEEVANLCP